jgi:flagellar biosynthesis GTPase FlhF
MLSELAPHEVHLVLSQGTGRRHGKRLIAEYESRRVTHLLGTKLDEFPGERCVEQLAIEHGLSVRWLSAGQDVPRDISVVSERQSEAEAA